MSRSEEGTPRSSAAGQSVRRHGVQVFSETRTAEADEYLRRLDRPNG